MIDATVQDYLASARAEGQEQELPANRPLLLAGQGRAWLINSGQVDLFLVPLDGGQPRGARRHLLRAEAGELLPGHDFEQVCPGWGVLAVGSPDTHIVELPERHLNLVEQAEVLQSLVVQWVRRLSPVLGRGTPPEECRPSSGLEQAELAADESLQIREALRWVRITQGEARLNGNAALSLDADSGLFPLLQRGWLQAGEPGCTLELRADAAEALREDPQWQILARFHRLCFQAVLGQARAEQEGEAARLERKLAAERTDSARAMQQLLGVLNPEAAEAPGAEAGDPLLAACRIVGRQVGIEFRAPAGQADAARSRDPLGDITRASRVRRRQVALKGHWWRRDNGVLLAFHEDDDRPVGLLPRQRGGGYEAHDPVSGAITVVDEGYAATLKPFAWCFYRPFGGEKLTLVGLMRFGAWGRLREFVLIGLMATLVGLLGLVAPWAAGELIDSVIPTADHGQLGQLTLLLVSVAFASAMFGLTQSFTQLRLEGKMDSVMQSAVWDRLLNLPTRFFRDYTAGDLAVRANGITSIRQQLSGTTMNSIISSLFTVFALGLMFYYSSVLAWIGLGLVLVLVVLSAGLSWLALRHERKLAAVEGRISGLLLQLLSGVAKLRTAGAESRAFSRWAANFRDQQTHTYRAETVKNVLVTLNAVFPLITSMTLFASVAFLLEPDELTTGAFLAFNAATGSLTGALLGLTETLSGVLGIVPLYERAKPILHSAPEVDDAKADPGLLRGQVDVHGLTFAYGEDEPPVLRNVNLSVAPGEFVAIVGPSGSGKSTLLRLLLGFETPDQGTVGYDDQDLASLDVGAVRRQLGVVLQKGQLMDGDIFTNIVGSQNLTLQEAEEAARMSGLDGDIAQMPMGMHTVVSDGGGTLSGGQRQRLLIARAIVHKPRLLFFDEATSALDNRTQARVSQSLEQLQATRIVIAHRLSTVVNADRIIVLKDGQVVEQGGYQELMERDGLFADMAKRQVA